MKAIDGDALIKELNKTGQRAVCGVRTIKQI